MRMSRQRQSRTQADDFASTPYMNIMEFLKDFAALAKCHEDQMQRSVGKGDTVLGSLMTATEPAELGYIMNVGRFIHETLRYQFYTARRTTRPTTSS